jgi:hypothetical protein
MRAWSARILIEPRVMITLPSRSVMSGSFAAPVLLCTLF